MMIGFILAISLFVTNFCEPSCDIVIEGLDVESVGSFALEYLTADNSMATIPAALSEYAQSKVLVKCSITKSCGAQVIQGPPFCSTTPTNPQCDGSNPLLFQLPTFNATCKKCSDISAEDVCLQNEYTCRWNKGKCQKTNCPHLFSDRYKGWKDSGLSMDEYIEEMHGKEFEPYTKEACKSHGCIYSPSTYWCSGWATWALITTIVICVLFVIVVVVVVVVICKFCRRGKKVKNVEVDIVNSQSTDAEKVKNVDVNIVNSQSTDAEKVKNVDGVVVSQSTDSEKVKNVDVDVVGSQSTGAEKVGSVDVDVVDSQSTNAEKVESVDVDVVVDSQLTNTKNTENNTPPLE